MPCIFYASNAAGHVLKNRLVRLTGDRGLEWFDDIEKLIIRLRFVAYGEIDLIILILSSQKEMSLILSVREFLLGHRIVMVLPDSDPETFEKGHRLYPRFLCHETDPYSHAAAVLKKMLTKDKNTK